MIRIAVWAFLLACLHGAHVLAAVSFTNNEYYVHEGTPFTITWTGNQGPVTVTLMKGPDANLLPVLTIVSDYLAQEYSWTPPPTLAADSYELRIEDAGSTDYSPRFKYPAPILSSTSTAASNSGATPALPSSSPSTASTTTPSSFPSSSSSSGGSGGEVLSTPAKAIIGALGGALLIAVIAFLVYCTVSRRRKNREREAALSFGGGTGYGTELPPLSAVGSGYYDAGRSPSTVVGGSSYGGSHVGNVMGVKVEGQQQPAELGGRDMVELSAEGRYLK